MGSTDAAQELAALVTVSPTPQLLLSTDLVIAAASDSYLEMMDAARSDFVGRPVRQALAQYPGLEEMVSSLEKALRTGRPQRLTGDRFRAAPAARRGDSGGIAVNSPVRVEGGKVGWILHTVCGVLDSSVSRATEASRQAAEARLRSIMETIPDAMIIIDGRGRIESISATAERLFGYSMAEVAGKNVKMFMPSPHREQHDGYLHRYLTTGERHIIGIGRVVVGQRKDGTTFPMHLTIGELRSGNQHYFTGFIRDLTDQQLTESRLKELQAEVTHMSRFTALGEMASAMAHEINQPLTAITNYLRGCQRLLDQVENDSAGVFRDALGKAADQAIRAGQIIRRLREFVARGDTERQIENLQKLIEDASTLALLGAKEDGVVVSFRLDPDAKLVMVDRIQIQQVLVNLIRNAIDVLAESSVPRKLTVATVAQQDSTVQVSVADNGSGLAPEVAAQLFQPFVTTKRKGMGLGLSVSRTIVEAHGGKIWAEANPGGGTVFRFTLHSAADEEVSRA
jgi:two-component system sensor kinase FixL